MKNSTIAVSETIRVCSAALVADAQASVMRAQRAIQRARNALSSARATRNQAQQQRDSVAGVHVNNLSSGR